MKDKNLTYEIVYSTEASGPDSVDIEIHKVTCIIDPVAIMIEEGYTKEEAEKIVQEWNDQTNPDLIASLEQRAANAITKKIAQLLITGNGTNDEEEEF